MATVQSRIAAFSTCVLPHLDWANLDVPKTSSRTAGGRIMPIVNDERKPTLNEQDHRFMKLAQSARSTEKTLWKRKKLSGLPSPQSNASGR